MIRITTTKPINKYTDLQNQSSVKQHSGSSPKTGHKPLLVAGFIFVAPAKMGQYSHSATERKVNYTLTVVTAVWTSAIEHKTYSESSPKTGLKFLLVADFIFVAPAKMGQFSHSVTEWEVNYTLTAVKDVCTFVAEHKQHSGFSPKKGLKPLLAEGFVFRAHAKMGHYFRSAMERDVMQQAAQVITTSAACKFVAEHKTYSKSSSKIGLQPATGKAFKNPLPPPLRLSSGSG